MSKLFSDPKYLHGDKVILGRVRAIYRGDFSIRRLKFTSNILYGPLKRNFSLSHDGNLKGFQFSRFSS